MNDEAYDPDIEVALRHLLVARITWLVCAAVETGNRSVPLTDLLDALNEPKQCKSDILRDRALWLEMELHDDWSFLIPTYAGHEPDPAIEAHVQAILRGEVTDALHIAGEEQDDEN